MISTLTVSQAIKQEKPNRVICDADEIDIYSKEESFACQSVPICSIPHTSPLTVSQLDFAGRGLGQRR